jgi:hypothetical protein
MNKKGSGSIGGLVFLIAIFIILYVLVMPPCDKCQLLGGDCDDVCDEDEFKGVLLFDDLGSVAVNNRVVHELDPVNLYIRVEDETKDLASSLFVNRGWFGNVDQDLAFELEDLDNVDVVYFTFKVTDSSGKLYIELNGHTVFSEKVEVGQGKVVQLPVSYLKEDNDLKMYVDSPGLAFWRKNNYDIKDLEIRQEFEKVHYEESRKFSISKNEKEHLDSASLDVSFFCSSAEGLSILKVYLNDDLLSSESLACESLRKSYELNVRDLEDGENEVKFIIDNGNFLLSPVEVISNLDQEIYPSYSFDIEESVYDFADEYYLSLYMGEGDKEANMLLNNYNIELDTGGSYFEKEITSFVKKGNNFLEIIPIDDFQVNEIKIWYE